MSKEIRKAQLRRHLQSDNRARIERDLARLRRQNVFVEVGAWLFLLALIGFAVRVIAGILTK